MMKKFIISILIAIIIVTILSIIIVFKNNKKENNDNMKTIKLNEVTRSVFYAPQYVAINKNLFKNEGLNIDITTGQGADAVMTSIIADQTDIGLCGPEASIYVYNQGKEDYSQVFAQLTKRDGSFLVSKNQTSKFSWDEVRGKTIIPGRKGGVPYMTLEYVLRHNGIDPNKDVILDDSIKFDLMAGAFTGGNADYVTLFEPTASMTQDAKKGYIVTSVGEAAGEVPYTAYCAKKSFISNNSEEIKKFTRAIYEGQKWVKNHNEKEIAEVIQSFFPDTSLDSLEKSVKSYKDIDAWNETPVLKKESFEKLETIMTEAGELNAKALYEKIINNQFAEEVVKEN